jgi:hypothetical protein
MEFDALSSEDTILDSSDVHMAATDEADESFAYDPDGDHFHVINATRPRAKPLPEVQPRGVPQRSTSIRLVPQIPTPNRGCHSMLFRGNCNRDSCPYDHSPKAMQTLCKETVSQLKQSKYYSNLDKTDQFTALFSNIVQKSPNMRSDATILLAQSSISCVALFDTGASDNFISAGFVASQPSLAELQTHCNFSVTLGDSSVCELTRCVDVTVVFPSAVNSPVAARFHVIPHDNHDIIIGLPLICSDLKDVFMSILDRNSDADHPLSTLHSLEATLDADTDLTQPWSHVLEPAEEEDLAPSPVSFRVPTNFLGDSFESAFGEYESLLATHIDPDFAASTDIVAQMRTKWYPIFVPRDWTGITGIDPVSITLKPGFPERLKPPARPINPKLFQVAKTEFDRLSKYFYVPSQSPIASPLVIAPKATKPFVRICGDYTPINKYMVPNQTPIPNVRHSLNKIFQFKVFFDLDMSNSFHQFPLSTETSELLSVQTPFGQYRPLFMPEGIAIASGILQSTMYTVFADFDEFMVVIFDNLLVLAHDYSDGLRKLDLVFQRCLDRNIHLKMAKSFLGYASVNFFGYVCTANSYTLSDDRKKAILDVPLPQNLKQLQSFLGTAIFFAPFVPNFSALAAPLYEFTHKKSGFDSASFADACHDVFSTLKTAMVNCLSIFYPDYSLNWILRTDASQLGVGGILYQQLDTSVLQPIAIVSKKFSSQATKWSTIEQEAFGIFHCVQQLAYYLRAKCFILETDHRNLLFMEQSIVPKIIRWRAYLQSFQFLLRHIPGKDNVAADYLSKAFNVIAASPASSSSTPSSNLSGHQTLDEMFRQVHNARWGHSGIARTYARLNATFPGHKFSIKQIENCIAHCPTCQKCRLGHGSYALEPVYRHLKVQHLHSAIGVDLLTVTPADRHGNQVIIVIVVFFSKLVYLYPAKDYTASTLAMAIFTFFCQYGVYEEIHSDPGSNLTSDALQELNKWFGVQHIFSLVDVHTSCGVERTNQEILRHLRALVCDERIATQWSDDTVLPLIAFLLNSEVNSETNVIPFELHFGSKHLDYHKLPLGLSVGEKASDSLRQINKNLEILQEITSEYQSQLTKERASTKPQNQFQPGDFVLKRNSHPRAKLDSKYLGPYRVLSQYKNDVECKHIVQGSIHIFHVDMLKPFFGSEQDAFKVAQMDYDQYEVTTIIAYFGNPLKRKTMKFEVCFADGTTKWLPYSSDLFDCIAYEDYCVKLPQLFPLLHKQADSQADIVALNKTAITEVSENQVKYVLLRAFGELWYSCLDLPDAAHVQYVVQAVFGPFVAINRLKIYVSLPVFNVKYIWNHCMVRMYGGFDTLDNCVLVDDEFIAKHPVVSQREATKVVE